MKPLQTLPRTIATLADAAAMENMAQRVETPCGDGTMVWHVWGEGSPLLLIHGGSGSWYHWIRNIAPLVGAGYRVCVPDLPGCGDSAMPPVGHDGDALPEWIEKGLGELIGDAECDAVAFCFGSMVSGFLAAQYPNRVRRLVLVSAQAIGSVAMSSFGLRDWVGLPEGPQRDAVHRFNLRRLMFAKDESVDELSLALYVSALRRDRLTRRRMAQTDVLLRTLPQIRCPVWSIFGADDITYARNNRVATIAPALKHAAGFQTLTMIPGAGHWVQYEAASAFNESLSSILEAQRLCSA